MTEVEELRKGVTRQNDPEWNRIVDSLISAVVRQTQNQYKEALAKQNEAWQRECARQCQSAEAMGKAEGAEHDT